MTVLAFPTPASPAIQGGMTHAQAMELHRRAHTTDDAIPTITRDMGVDYESACDTLAGKHWPGAKRYWSDMWGRS